MDRFDSQFDRLQKQEEGEGFREYDREDGSKFFRKGEPGDWKNVLTNRQAAEIEQDHGAVMEELGYTLEMACA